MIARAGITRRTGVVGAKAEAAAAAPLWLQVSTLALSAAGFAVSLYLTIAHYTTSVTLACPDSGVVDCAKVTTSPQSVLFGVFPVADLGLAFYVFMVAVNTPWAWRAAWPAIGWIRMGSLIVGIAFVIYLVYTELFTLNAICLWCTGIHAITFMIFALTISSQARSSVTSASKSATSRTAS